MMKTLNGCFSSLGSQCFHWYSDSVYSQTVKKYYFVSSRSISLLKILFFHARSFIDKNWLKVKEMWKNQNQGKESWESECYLMKTAQVFFYRPQRPFLYKDVGQNYFRFSSEKRLKRKVIFKKKQASKKYVWKVSLLFVQVAGNYLCRTLEMNGGGRAWSRIPALHTEMSR